ncbi:uncharacterized protein [Venturia canescens]|uniref:uncharacterized protein n=1 Tax=Venturia canescens TaxID=32260 RepID=UPI001C9C6713|nr:uncharacterized protein LOC122408000 [Venturia canescens]
MIGRFRERRYQLTAARRNEAIIKLDHNLETARYFERECSKAKQFNVWSTSNESQHLIKSKKAESLNCRRTRLKDLLEREQESYTRECERQKTNKTIEKVKNYNPSLRLEKRAEESLYRPLNCRRIQSYFCGPYLTSQDYVRPVLRDFNDRNVDRKTSRVTMDKTNLRPQDDTSLEHVGKPDKWLGRDNLNHGQKNYNERMDVYKENSRNAKASSIYGGEGDTADANWNAPCENPSFEHRPRSRKLHDSHFHLGDDEESSARDEREAAKAKYKDRYANKSLEDTNVGKEQENDKLSENGVDLKDEGNVENGDSNDDLNENSEHHEQDEIDRACEPERELIEECEPDEKKHQVSLNSSSIGDKSSENFHENDEEQQLQSDAQAKQDQRDIDREVDAKASAGKSDRRHFESEKSMPWLRMIPGDKNLSEQMFLYLSHNELKERIQNLENRENQACSKHQWDEALRLRDMRNRLDLAREKNLYRRDDLRLDPEVKKLGMASIETRQRLLKSRENICTNTSMYSEEAKEIWDKWVLEDSKSILMDASVQRETLMRELEENWRSLAVDDKQRISDSFKDKNFINEELQNCLHNNSKVG